MVASEGDLRILFLCGSEKLDNYFFSLQKTIIYSRSLLKWEISIYTQLLAHGKDRSNAHEIKGSLCSRVSLPGCS